MTKIQRQQAAWKVQEEMEIAAEQARLEKLATYVDVELQQINQADQAKPAKEKTTQEALAAWEALDAQPWHVIEAELRAATAPDKHEEDIVGALERFHNILSTRARIRGDLKAALSLKEKKPRMMWLTCGSGVIASDWKKHIEAEANMAERDVRKNPTKVNAAALKGWIEGKDVRRGLTKQRYLTLARLCNLKEEDCGCTFDDKDLMWVCEDHFDGHDCDKGPDSACEVCHVQYCQE